MSDYDCYHLINDADFEIRISHDVFWVPANSLGKTRYKNCDISKFVKYSPEEKRRIISNLYEAIQLFIASGFTESPDISHAEVGGFNWEYHKSGREAVLTNTGCCASVAAWFRYILADKYETAGYITFTRPTGNGHAFNFFVNDGWFYLYDMYPWIIDNTSGMIPEKGQVSYYLKAPYITAGLFKCRNLESYVRYYSRVLRTRNFDHLFFKQETDVVSPLAVERGNGEVTVVYPNSRAIQPIGKPDSPTIHFKKSGVSLEELLERKDLV